MSHLAHLAARRAAHIVIVLAFALLGAALLVACDGDSSANEERTSQPEATATADETPVVETVADETPSDVETNGGPPPMTVAAGDASMQAGFGSFCYGGLCADTIGYTTPAEPLPAGGATALRGEVASDTITEVSATASPASALESQEICTGDFVRVGPTCDAEDTLLAWTGALGEGADLPATAAGPTTEIDISTLEPGSYVVNVFVRFASGGDASYGVLLEVA